MRMTSDRFIGYAISIVGLVICMLIVNKLERRRKEKQEPQRKEEALQAFRDEPYYRFLDLREARPAMLPAQKAELEKERQKQESQRKKAELEKNDRNKEQNRAAIKKVKPQRHTALSIIKVSRLKKDGWATQEPEFHHLKIMTKSTLKSRQPNRQAHLSRQTCRF